MKLLITALICEVAWYTLVFLPMVIIILEVVIYTCKFLITLPKSGVVQFYIRGQGLLSVPPATLSFRKQGVCHNISSL
jgi:hypothetical protein